MRIVTRYTSNASGRSQVIAKGGGKQRTISVNLAESVDQNHVAAAAALIERLSKEDSWITGDAIQAIDEGNATREIRDDGSHVFNL